MALQRFFDAASKQKWYQNTLFVITADHTGESCRNVYQTDLGKFAVPIVLYAPGDTTLRRGVDDRQIAQHTDIMPTVLGYLATIALTLLLAATCSTPLITTHLLSTITMASTNL